MCFSRSFFVILPFLPVPLICSNSANDMPCWSAKFVTAGDTVAFKKNSEYRFDINDEKLYRMRVNDICVKL